MQSIGHVSPDVWCQVQAEIAIKIHHGLQELTNTFQILLQSRWTRRTHRCTHLFLTFLLIRHQLHTYSLGRAHQYGWLLLHEPKEWAANCFVDISSCHVQRCTSVHLLTGPKSNGMDWFFLERHGQIFHAHLLAEFDDCTHNRFQSERLQWLCSFMTHYKEFLQNSVCHVCMLCFATLIHKHQKATELCSWERSNQSFNQTFNFSKMTSSSQSMLMIHMIQWFILKGATTKVSCWTKHYERKGSPPFRFIQTAKPFIRMHAEEQGPCGNHHVISVCGWIRLS